MKGLLNRATSLVSSWHAPTRLGALSPGGSTKSKSTLEKHGIICRTVFWRHGVHRHFSCNDDEICQRHLPAEGPIKFCDTQTTLTTSAKTLHEAGIVRMV